MWKCLGRGNALRPEDLTPILFPKESLFVKQRLPVRRHPFGWSGHRLIQRMRVRSGKLRAGEEFLCTIVVKPSLAVLETRDDRVTRSGVMFRRMLTW